jgi:hypothetical protein
MSSTVALPRFQKLFGRMVAVSLIGVASWNTADAASFSISSGGQSDFLQSNFATTFLSTAGNNPDNIHGGGAGDLTRTAITIFDATHAGGVSVVGADGGTQLTYTYLGDEAGYTNLFVAGGSTLFQNHNTSSPLGFETPGGTKGGPTSVASGLLSFLFRSVTPGNKDAVNGGPIDAQVKLAFAKISDILVYAFLEDIANGDKDFDDMVIKIELSQRDPGPRVDPTPLPGAAWLFSSALATGVGFSAWRRKRRRAAS